MYDKQQENHYHQKYNQKDVQLTLNMFDQLIELLNAIDTNIEKDNLVEQNQ
jgi:hypothetical protein